MPATRAPKRKSAALAEHQPEQKSGGPRKGLVPRSSVNKVKATTKAAEAKKVAAAAAKVKKVSAKSIKEKSSTTRQEKAITPIVEHTASPTHKKPRGSPKPTKEKAPLVKLTSAPTKILNVYTFGTGENGELGQGPLAKEVKRPRLNKFILPEVAGIVSLAVGGMHALALAQDGKLWSWGVNDLCALGRETKGDEQTRTIADDSDSDDDVAAMNKYESTPMLVEAFPQGAVITKIAAGDSISIAITETGQVYGWGTFRAADGVLGFSDCIAIQKTPILIDSLKGIVDICCGNDHVLALDSKGTVYAWGNGQQNQLGRRVVERTRRNGLIPRAVGFPGKKKIAKIFSGQYHSFAVGVDGDVWAWGLNGFAETGIYQEDAGEGLLTVAKPQKVESLAPYEIEFLAGGQHHSLAITASGDLMTWGRMDAKQTGIGGDKCPEEDVIKDVAGKDRLLINPTKICDVKFVSADCGIDHTIAIDINGQAWSWGYGGQFAVGQGLSEDDVSIPTKIENTATRGVRMQVASCGGNFSTLAGIPLP